MSLLQRIMHAKHFKSSVIVIFFALSGFALFGIWVYGHYYVSTDDAYINANVVQIAPRITGKVVNLYVDNNQYVQKGQPLFDIDATPFQLAINSAQAQLTLSMAELENASITKQRTLALVKKQYVSPQNGDNAIANFKIAAAKVDAFKANLSQANLNMVYTRMTAPTAGWITNMTLRAGDIVPANQPLFALISDEGFWADANFKETEMESIKVGQTALIVTDLYPAHRFKGRVESISGGTGSVFSLLPPQNATGNWVKVTQRLPVRIRIFHPGPKHQLRIGISATVTIDLHSILHNER